MSMSKKLDPNSEGSSKDGLGEVGKSAEATGEPLEAEGQSLSRREVIREALRMGLVGYWGGASLSILAGETALAAPGEVFCGEFLPSGRTMPDSLCGEPIPGGNSYADLNCNAVWSSGLLIQDQVCSLDYGDGSVWADKSCGLMQYLGGPYLTDRDCELDAGSGTYWPDNSVS